MVQYNDYVLNQIQYKVCHMLSCKQTSCMCLHSLDKCHGDKTKGIMLWLTLLSIEMK